MHIFMIMIFLCIGMYLGSFMDAVIRLYCREENEGDTGERTMRRMFVDALKNTSFHPFSGTGNSSMRENVLRLLTPLLLLITYFEHGLGLEFLLESAFWTMIIMVSWIDYRTLCIYDHMLWFYLSLFIFFHILISPERFFLHILGGGLCFLLFFIFHNVTKFFYRREVFGFGDVLLNGILGFYFGVEYVFSVSFLPFYLALFFLILLKVSTKKISPSDEIPFAPFMCLSGALISLMGEKIFLFFPDVLSLLF